MAGLWGWRALYVPLAILAFILGVLIRPALLPAQNPNAGKVNPVALPGRKPFFFAAVLWQQMRNYPRYMMSTTTRLGLLLAVTISATVAGLVTYLGVWLASDFGMSLKTIGLVFLVIGAASVAGALGGGWFADRLGKRRMIALSSVLLAIVLFWVSAVQTRTGVFLFCAAGGMAMALREGPFQALISELVPAAERGAYIALRNSTSQLAIAVAAAACGLLFERFGFQAVAYFAAGCSVAASGVALSITEPAAHTRAFD
jgi:predicted MFS family arabinose efflux permease